MTDQKRHRRRLPRLHWWALVAAVRIVGPVCSKVFLRASTKQRAIRRLEALGC